jgi:hypothetical protein
VEFVSWQMVNIAEIRHELGVEGGQDATIPYNRPQGEPAILFLLLSRIRWLSPPFETVNGAVPGIGRATVLHRSCMSPKVICMNDESLLESC